MTDGLFSDSIISIDPEKDYSPEIIGEGKKYNSVKEAARAILEKDAFIKRQQLESKELRDDLNKRQTAEEILTKIQQSNRIAEPTLAPTNESMNSSLLNVKEEDLNALIQKRVSETVGSLTAEAEAKKNVETVKEGLVRLWGEDYATQLKTKANELGVSEEWVTNAARTTPKVLLKLVSDNAQREETNLFSSTPKGINTAGLNRSNTSNLPQEAKYSYWQAMRKENPNLYHSVASASKRHENAQKHGEAFYSN